MTLPSDSIPTAFPVDPPYRPCLAKRVVKLDNQVFDHFPCTLSWQHHGSHDYGPTGNIYPIRRD